MMRLVKPGFQFLRRDDRGQDAFEYLLVIGVIMVAVVAAVKAGGPDAAGAVWTAVQTAVVNAA
jgi:Flp pilus assembly pilin Flp